MSLKFFRIFRVEFEILSQMYISGLGSLLIHHFGHSLTYNFFYRIPQFNSQYMQEYYTIKSQEIPEGFGKKKKLEN